MKVFESPHLSGAGLAGEDQTSDICYCSREPFLLSVDGGL